MNTINTPQDLAEKLLEHLQYEDARVEEVLRGLTVNLGEHLVETAKNKSLPDLIHSINCAVQSIGSLLEKANHLDGGLNSHRVINYYLSELSK